MVRYIQEARGSVVGSGTATARRSRVRIPIKSLEFSIDLPAALWPWDRHSL
jgi:hypothetical protein